MNENYLSLKLNATNRQPKYQDGKGTLAILQNKKQFKIKS